MKTNLQKLDNGILHAMWLSLEKYIVTLDRRLEKFSAEFPDLAKKYRLFRAISAISVVCIECKEVLVDDRDEKIEGKIAEELGLDNGVMVVICKECYKGGGI